MATVPLTGTPGFRFLWHLYPTGRAGGLNYYPYASIDSGLTPSWTPPAASGITDAPFTQTVAIAAGKATLDSQPASLAGSVNVVVDPLDATFAPPVYGVNNYPIYLNPTRVLQPIPIGDSAPTTYLNGVAISAGARYAEAIDFGEYLSARAFYEYDGASWVQFDPTFAAPSLPAQPGKNRIWGGDTLPTVTTTNFTVRHLEKRVYIESIYPPYTNSNAKALLRDSCSLEVANLALYYFVLPVSITVATEAGSASITTDQATANILADMVAAAGSVGALAVKLTGDTGFFTGGGASSNVTAISGTTITTATTVVEDNSNITLTIYPQVAGKNYLLAPAKSVLLVNSLPV